MSDGEMCPLILGLWVGWVQLAFFRLPLLSGYKSNDQAWLELKGVSQADSLRILVYAPRLNALLPQATWYPPLPDNVVSEQCRSSWDLARKQIEPVIFKTIFEVRGIPTWTSLSERKREREREKERILWLKCIPCASNPGRRKKPSGGVFILGKANPLPFLLLYSE